MRKARDFHKHSSRKPTKKTPRHCQLFNVLSCGWQAETTIRAVGANKATQAHCQTVRARLQESKEESPDLLIGCTLVGVAISDCYKVKMKKKK